MAIKTDLGKKLVMEQVQGFCLSRRPGHAHRPNGNQAIIRALAGGASVSQIVSSLGVKRYRVRRLARWYANQVGSSPTVVGGSVARPPRRAQGVVTKPLPSVGGSQSLTGSSGTAAIIQGATRPAPLAVVPSTVVGPEDMEHQIRALLIQHLGSENAADSWLNSTNMGYPTTAMDMVRAGRGDLVLDDLENQWGPSPSYA